MSKRFDKLLERATAPTLLEPDWEGILNCVDSIRSGDVPPKSSVASIKKRYHSENPHVAHHTLLVLEASMKNCGEKFHREVATKEFMEDMKHMAMETGTDKIVKEKLLELVQCWAHAFRNNPEYKIVVDTHNLMKLEGFEFPSLREADAMFAADSAPEWVDSDKCYRCRAEFGLLTRKHHCRNCGQIFCDKCSNRQTILPHIGIEKEVRICETCWEKLSKKTEGAGDAKAKPAAKTGVSQSAAGDGKPKEEQVRQREEEELQLAMAISQSEEEEKERQRQRQLMQLYNGPDSSEDSAKDYYPPPDTTRSSAIYKGMSTAPEQDKVTPMVAEADPVDPELARYLNRTYWETRRTEQKQGMLRQSPTPSAPPPSETSSSELMNGLRHAEEPPPQPPSVQNGELEAGEDDTARFATLLKNQVEVFVNRIRSNQMRGRSIVNDSSINTLFLTLTNLHADVLARIQKLDDQRSHFESLQDKLAHMQEARQAVDALREEHQRRRQAELIEAQRVRQIQMQTKLEVMRHKKHEMLEQQRLMALQRMQQQQQELQMRKQMQAMGITLPPGQVLGYPPQMTYQMTYPMGTYNPAPPPVETMPTPSTGYAPAPGMPTGYAPAPAMPPGYAPAPGMHTGYAAAPEMMPTPPTGYAAAPGMPTGYAPAPGMPMGYAPAPGMPTGYAPAPEMPTGYAAAPEMMPAPHSGVPQQMAQPQQQSEPAVDLLISFD